MLMTLDGKRVLVIGGGSGIGFAVAEGAQREGAVVTIASSNTERIAAAAQRLGNSATGATIDVTDEASVEGFFAASDGFDHIVFTAGDWGGPRNTGLADLDLSRATDVFRVRFLGALAVAKHGAPKLAAGGSLTLTNGMVAHRPSKGRFLSSGMAGGIEHLTRGLAVELAPIRVNCVCPAMIRTEIWDAMLPAKGRDERFAKMTERQLIPRIGEPGETAEAYLYLMKAGYTTGQVLKVEGGVSLGQ
jgi:NAD(P)-dependent dehydrogenase (short-subunit alcohol dehydrogenase family)